jgi:hypothetical protein
MARLRQEALARQKARKACPPGENRAEDGADARVAGYLGVSEAMVSSCCGSICPHCDVFLDKAIALVELGLSHHLFMNPSQEEFFNEALEIYRLDRTGYIARRQELMDRMRR